MIAWTLLGIVYALGGVAVWLGFFVYTLDNDPWYVKLGCVALWPVFVLGMIMAIIA